MSRLAPILLLAALGCVTPKHANQCPGSAPLGCMTKPTCVEDKTKGCVVCTCDAPDAPPAPPPNTTPP